jgi:hypothetical protein
MLSGCLVQPDSHPQLLEVPAGQLGAVCDSRLPWLLVGQEVVASCKGTARIHTIAGRRRHLPHIASTGERDHQLTPETRQSCCGCQQRETAPAATSSEGCLALPPHMCQWFHNQL